MHIKIFGPGCMKCNETENIVKSVILETGSKATVEKLFDLNEMMSLGIMSTPAVVIDDKVMIAGSVPGKKDIRGWLGLGVSSQDNLSTGSCCCSSGCGCK